MRSTFILILATALSYMSTPFAKQLEVSLFTTDPAHQPVGSILFTDSPYGLLITPNLTNLPKGIHGLHLHQNPSCENQGQDAGGHFDPDQTNSHKGPYGKGHLGDLPAIYVDEEGNATIPTLAPRLETSNLDGLSVMIHGGGDTYSDTPKLGGGGERIACGVVNN